MTTIRLGEVDDEAIESIKERWGLTTDTAAIRFALRVVAQAERLEVVPPGPSSDSPEQTQKEADDDT